MKLEAGKYYIGDLKYILDFADFEATKTLQSSKVVLKSGVCINFPADSYALVDNSGFKYCIDSYSFGIASANIINDELLSSRYFALQNGILVNKFSGFILARVVRFSEDFEAIFTNDLVSFGDINISL